MAYRSHKGLVESNTYCGTEPYMAPEILELSLHKHKHKTYNVFESDIWALGVILFAMINNEYPFSSKDKHKMFKLQSKREWHFSRETKVKLTPLLKDILNKMLEPVHSKRIEM